MKKAWLAAILAGCGTTLYAQDTLTVNKDPRLDILHARLAAANKMAARMTSNGMFKGYRLQVISTRNREQAFAVKANLLQKFPEQKTYALYQSPYFKIRIGNFLERADAERLRKSMAAYYPQGVFVVEDVIDYVPLEQEEH